jgi:hypothetical protein
MRDRHWCRREQCGSAATHRAPGAGRKGPPTSPRFCSQRRNLRNLDQCLERDRCAVSPSIRTISIASGPTAGATRMAPRRWWQRFGLICPKQSGAKRKCGLTGKIEASPSQDKPFGSGVTRRIFSLRSIRSKMPLGLCGADVAIGVTSFTAVGRSCGPRAEPRLSRLLPGGQSSKWPSSSGRRSIIAPARSCSLACVRSRNGVPTSTCRSCLKAIPSATSRSSGSFSRT